MIDVLLLFLNVEQERENGLLEDNFHHSMLGKLA